jgi:hypothetical protein
MGAARAPPRLAAGLANKLAPIARTAAGVGLILRGTFGFLLCCLAQ